MHSRLLVNSRAVRACAIDFMRYYIGGRVRHTRTICSFPGSLATHELFRSLLNSIIIHVNEACYRAARACAVDSLEKVEQLEHAQQTS